MTSNKNKLFLICLGLLLILSVGYAYFSENINVAGTVSAQSSWSITTTCDKGINSKFLAATEFDPSDVVEGSYESDSCTVSGQAVTSSVTLKMPSAARFFTVKVKNTGGVDAVINADGIDPSVYKLQLYKKSDDSLYNEYIKSSSNGFWNIAEDYANVVLVAVGIEDESGNIYVSNLEEDEEYFLQHNMLYEDTDGNTYLKVAPNQTLYFLIGHVWEPDAEETEYYGKTISTYNFELKQFTSDLKVSTDGFTCFAGC